MIFWVFLSLLRKTLLLFLLLLPNIVVLYSVDYLRCGSSQALIFAFQQCEKSRNAAPVYVNCFLHTNRRKGPMPPSRNAAKVMRSKDRIRISARRVSHAELSGRRTMIQRTAASNEKISISLTGSLSANRHLEQSAHCLLTAGLNLNQKPEAMTAEEESQASF